MVLANINSTSSVSTSRLSLSPLISHTGFQDAEKKCQLLGPVALVVQGCMGVFVVLSLVVKRQYEGNAKKGIPRRRWRVWSMDVGKQLIGQGFVHFLNVWISAGVASHEGDINPCSLYFLNVLIDTTIGVLFLYLAIRGFTWTCERIFGQKPGFRSGVYGDPPGYRPFFLQLAIYLVSLTLMKIGVIVLFYLCAEKVLLPFAGWLIGWMGEDVQVIVVMAVFPLIMNILQFCLVDSLIKGKRPADEAGTPSVTAPKDGDADADAGEHGEDGHDDFVYASRPQSRASSHKTLRSHELDPNLLSPRPSSPTTSARAPLLTTASRRASPYSSPTSPSLVLGIVLGLVLMMPMVAASSGDRLPAFQSCVEQCVSKQCTPDSPPLAAILRAFRWSCRGDCAYHCTHSVTSGMLPVVHQYYGKWPFWRLGGIQEPASVLFSLGNGWVHYKGLRKVWNRLRQDVQLKKWVMAIAVFQMNTWFWSAIFHTRDTPFTEKMDYFSATATIMCTLLYTLVRTFHLFPRADRPRGAPALLPLVICFVIAYVSHITYLLSGPRFDYGWNVLFNLMMGATHLSLWSLFSMSFRTRLPWPFSLIPTPYPPLDPLFITPKPAWSGRSAILVMATTAAMSLELFDFPPFLRILDAHSLWHLATILIARGWYSFLIRDVVMLEAVSAGGGSDVIREAGK